MGMGSAAVAVSVPWMTDQPAPVTVTNPEPIAVTMDELPAASGPAPTERERVARGIATEADRAVLAGETVARARADESSLVAVGQREISRIWERTQQIIALSVVETTLIVVSLLVVSPIVAAANGRPADEAAKTAAVAGMLFLTAVSNLVIGFYFGRTNHQRVGGIGGDQAGTR